MKKRTSKVGTRLRFKASSGDKSTGNDTHTHTHAFFNSVLTFYNCACIKQSLKCLVGHGLR